MQVFDLETGKSIGSPITCKNPQIAYGNDVISRIVYTINNKNGLKELQKVLIDGINSSLTELEKRLNVSKGSISSSIIQWFFDRRYYLLLYLVFIHFIS